MKNVKDLTSLEIALEIVKENQPIDYKWLAHLKLISTDEELLEWCKRQVDYSVSDLSKNKITRTANALKILLFR